ncbi:MAG: RNA ligase family protein [Polyangiaceae bacterium]
MAPKLFKYPRTRHLQGSRLGPGDEDLDAVPLAALSGAHLVVEEKLDGANCAVSFDEAGGLLLQSRGHYLVGGPREKHFALLKTWANAHRAAFAARLGSRYVMFGEWLFAKHTVYYDRLPHFFMEFDVLDRERGEFLSTPRRRELLQELPIASVPVLREGVGVCPKPEALIGPSLYKSETWRDSLEDEARTQQLPPEQVSRETDPSPAAEGLYLKEERDGRVVARYKFVRADFLASVLDSGTHWLSRPIVPNRLHPDVDIFAPAP